MGPAGGGGTEGQGRRRVTSQLLFQAHIWRSPAMPLLLHLAKEEKVLSSVVLWPLTEEETNVKEHALNGRFFSLTAHKAADISLR